MERGRIYEITAENVDTIIEELCELTPHTSWDDYLPDSHFKAKLVAQRDVVALIVSGCLARSKHDAECMCGAAWAIHHAASNPYVIWRMPGKAIMSSVLFKRI